MTVLNCDGDFANEVAKRAEASPFTEKIFTFACDKPADLIGYDIRSGKKEIRFKARCEAFDEEFQIGLPGIFNVSNALAAISIAYSSPVMMTFCARRNH